MTQPVAPRPLGVLIDHFERLVVAPDTVLPFPTAMSYRLSGSLGPRFPAFSARRPSVLGSARTALGDVASPLSLPGRFASGSLPGTLPAPLVCVLGDG